MLANISPCISILFWKWLSGFEAAWSSIASDSQPGCHCPLDQMGCYWQTQGAEAGMRMLHCLFLEECAFSLGIPGDIGEG